MRHYTGAGSTFIRKFYKAKVLATEHTSVKSHFRNCPGNRSQSKSHITFHLTTPHLRIHHIIMPHKKNPDVFELTRAKCNKLQALPQQIMMIMNNLPSGYFRDLQIIKEVFLPAFRELKECLQMAAYIMDKIKINEHILDDDRYLYIFSVEEVNRLASEGMPFRDAYKKVGLDIEAGKFTHDKKVHHTHEGSIGNLCNDRIESLMRQVVDGFNFSVMEQAERSLLGR